MSAGALRGLLTRLLAGVRFLSHATFGVPEASRRVLPRSAVLRGIFRFRESGFWFVLVALVIYTALLSWAHVHHEPWRDETHPWIVARQADGFWDLLTGDRRYDGHPPGWFWYLRLFTPFTRSLVGLHVATVLLSVGSAFLFLRFAPFARPIRLLLTFSFLFAFEYGVVCRNYSLGILFTFLFCSLVQPLRPRPLLLAFCLVGLALSSVYGAIIAGCLLLVLLAESIDLGRSGSIPGALQFRFETRGLLAAFIVLSGLLLSLLSSRPPDPNPYAPRVNLDAIGFSGFELSLSRMTWSTLPIRAFDSVGYWGGVDRGWQDVPTLFTLVGWSLAALMVVTLAAFPVELLAFVLGATAMVVVQQAVYPGSLRHWGHYLVLFVALAWTGRVRHPARWGWLLPSLLCVIGLFQFESFVVAVREEERFSFSGAGQVAEFIKRKKLLGTPIVGGPDWAMPAVMGHLDQNFISCETSEWNQTLVFHARRKQCSPSALLAKAANVVQATNEPVLLITMGPAGGLPPSGVSIQRMFRSKGPTATAEDFSLYRLAPGRNAAQSGDHGTRDKGAKHDDEGAKGSGKTAKNGSHGTKDSGKNGSRDGSSKKRANGPARERQGED